MRETPAEPGRVYRNIAYGPPLDVFMLDMRSYRGPDGPRDNRIYRPGDYLLGPQRLAWLKRELARSAATWKVIAADSPIGYAVNTAGIERAHGPRGRAIESPICLLSSSAPASATHAGTWTPVEMDLTFGPRVVFHKASSKEQGDNLAPCFGLQFFGHVAIDGRSQTLTVSLKDVADRSLWSMTLEPELSARASMLSL